MCFLLHYRLRFAAHKILTFFSVWVCVYSFLFPTIYFTLVYVFLILCKFFFISVLRSFISTIVRDFFLLLFRIVVSLILFYLSLSFANLNLNQSISFPRIFASTFFCRSLYGKYSFSQYITRFSLLLLSEFNFNKINQLFSSFPASHLNVYCNEKPTVWQCRSIDCVRVYMCVGAHFSGKFCTEFGAPLARKSSARRLGVVFFLFTFIFFCQVCQYSALNAVI